MKPSDSPSRNPSNDSAEAKSPWPAVRRAVAASLGLVALLALASCASGVDQDVAGTDTEQPAAEGGGDNEGDSNAGGDGDQQESTETSAAAESSDPVKIAEVFMKAHQEHDAAAIQAISDPNASVLEFGFWRRTPADYDGLFQWMAILKWDWLLDSCVEESAGPPSRVVCTYKTENEWSRTQNLDPVPGRFELLIDEGLITEVVLEISSDWGQVFGGWIDWLDRKYPEEVRVLYRFDEEDQLTGGPATDQEAIALYEIRIPEYVADETEVDEEE